LTQLESTPGIDPQLKFQKDLVHTHLLRAWLKKGVQTICREHVDSVIRYGGEEFLLVLPETDLNSGTTVAERLRTAIAENPAYRDGAQTVLVTASFGVASVDFSVPGHGVSPQSLITKADELLYCARKAGRNRVEFAKRSRETVAL
jgi:diguanylate cyclase (GGDEF)-like protein